MYDYENKKKALFTENCFSMENFVWVCFQCFQVAVALSGRSIEIVHCPIQTHPTLIPFG